MIVPRPDIGGAARVDAHRAMPRAPCRELRDGIAEEVMIVRDLWGTCLLPIPAPHRHIAWQHDGPFLCLLTNWWVPESAIIVNAFPDEWEGPSPTCPHGPAATPEPVAARRGARAR